MGSSPLLFVWRKGLGELDRQERYENPRELGRRIIELLEGDLASDGLSLLDVRVFRGGGRLQIRIYLDTLAGGITLDEVARASRTVGLVMENADIIGERYVIEVSSPGIRRPLRTEAHFQAAVGQQVDLKVAGPGRPARVKGLLTGIEAGILAISRGPADPDAAADEGEVSVEVPLAEVLEGNLDADFDPRALINADRRRRKEERRQVRAQKKTGRKSRPRKKT